MQLTITVDPVRAQYIAALVEFWELCDDDRRHFEEGDAIRMLPQLISDIAIALSIEPSFVADFAAIAESVRWDAKDRHVMKAIFALGSRAVLQDGAP